MSISTELVDAVKRYRWIDCYNGDADADKTTKFVNAKDFDSLKAENERLRAMLARCLPIVEYDARMMADITRFSPLDAESQAKHDSTEYESEKLVREIPVALAVKP
jgi:hypothetical protein